MSFSEKLSEARLASQRAEEIPSSARLSWEAYYCWKDVVEEAEALARLWKQKAEEKGAACDRLPGSPPGATPAKRSDAAEKWCSADASKRLCREKTLVRAGTRSRNFLAL